MCNFQKYEIEQPIKINELFGIRFHDSQRIEIFFSFKNCIVELGNLLYHFSGLCCKDIQVNLDSLKFNYTPLKMHSEGYMDDIERLIHHIVVKADTGDKR